MPLCMTSNVCFRVILNAIPAIEQRCSKTFLRNTGSEFLSIYRSAIYIYIYIVGRHSDLRIITDVITVVLLIDVII